MKKILALLLVVILTATVSISGTLAFVQASAAPDVTETEGPVKIDQQIYYRDITTQDGTQTCELRERTGGKETFLLYPAIYAGDTPSTLTVTPTNVSPASSMEMYAAPNAQDEIVVVKNTGTQEAYVRTWIAIECGSVTDVSEFERIITLKHTNDNNWGWEEAYIKNVEGMNYYILSATYTKALQQDETTSPSLLQVMMNKTAGNEECAKLIAHYPEKLTLDIHIFSQATGSDSNAAGFDTSSPEGIKAMMNNVFQNTPPGDMFKNN